MSDKDRTLNVHVDSPAIGAPMMGVHPKATKENDKPKSQGPKDGSKEPEKPTP